MLKVAFLNILSQLESVKVGSNRSVGLILLLPFAEGTQLFQFKGHILVIMSGFDWLWVSYR